MKDQRRPASVISTVMFRGTPCVYWNKKIPIKQRASMTRPIPMSVKCPGISPNM